ncbi:hemin-binding protein [Mycobacterium sp.]|uniref:hemin-binding protein n=1 Tax=Mycobacterium sp. TaxID=1785 RepID=UPI003D09CB39
MLNSPEVGGSAGLFDRKALYGGPALASESSFAFLSRASGDFWRRTRELAEAWYAHYPDTNGDLRARFRKDELRQHVAAWFELYVFSLFRLLGYQVEVHPALRGTSKRPDFLVTRDSHSAYIECTALVDSSEWTDSDCGAWLLDCLNGAHNPDFMVDLSVEQIGTQRPRAREIAGPVEQWLAKLNWGDVSSQIAAGMDAPTNPFEFRDWKIRLEAWPVVADRRGKPGRLVGSHLIGNENPRHDEDDVRRLLAKKGSYYGLQARPLVLAVLNWSGFIDEHDVTNALFGSVVVRYYQGGVNMPPPKQVRLQDGYWRPRGSTRGSRVAGVLFSDRLLKPWNPTSALPLLWVNPWAPERLPTMPPFGVRTAGESGRIQSTAPLRTAADVLKIRWDSDGEE